MTFYEAINFDGLVKSLLNLSFRVKREILIRSIPAVARSPRSASAISQIIYFPVMFFSGVLMPLDMLPDWIARYISPYLPVTHAVELMQGLWLGVAAFEGMGKKQRIRNSTGTACRTPPLTLTLFTGLKRTIH